MTDINLDRIKKYGLIVFFGAVVCLGIGAFDRIHALKIFGCSGFLWYLPLAALLFLALFLYYGFIGKCMRTGGRSAGLEFLRMIHKYRFLLEQLVTRDFKIKYKRSVLGVFWSFLNPLLMMIVQYVVFSYLLNIRGDVEHYAIYLLCGIVFWNGFNDCSTQAMRSITGNAALITKVYVPKFIYPISKVISASINVLLSMIPLLLVTLVYGLIAEPHLYFSKAILLLPFGLMFLLVFCIGIGFLLSAAMVFFHDIEFLWGVVMTIWMYATPIIYSLSMFEGKPGAEWIVKLMQFNPMYHLISFVRTIILERTSPAFTEYGICFLFAFGMLFIGYAVFKKAESKFILYL